MHWPPHHFRDNVIPVHPHQASQPSASYLRRALSSGAKSPPPTGLAVHTNIHEQHWVLRIQVQRREFITTNNIYQAVIMHLLHSILQTPVILMHTMQGKALIAEPCITPAVCLPRPMNFTILLIWSLNFGDLQFGIGSLRHPGTPLVLIKFLSGGSDSVG